MTKKTNKPIAVLISDLHFTVSTLELASMALLRAQHQAVLHNVPLIIAGDTLDTKAVMRAECVNQLLRLLSVRDAPKTYIMVGNHDLCNEKGEDHALQFLHGFNTVTVVDFPLELTELDITLVPYQSNTDKIMSILSDEDTTKTLIMHQGLLGAKMGHYIKDTTSMPPEAFDGRRVISGHYHARQDIKCGKTGLWSYIGNPYTLTFGEASDPEKGFQILNEDGSLTFVPTNLRKHVIAEFSVDNLKKFNTNPEDLVWLKVTGPKTELSAINKQELGTRLLGHSNYKLDLIPTDSTLVEQAKNNKTDSEILDTLIDSTSESSKTKKRLKALWRNL